MAAVGGLGPQVARRKEVLRGQLQWEMAGSQRRLKPAVKAGSQQRAPGMGIQVQEQKGKYRPSDVQEPGTREGHQNTEKARLHQQ